MDGLRTSVTSIKRGESGQIILFFVLVLFTLLSFAALVISVGQMLARKALAQHLADIGAFAGASQQASSLNYITDLDRVMFKFLRATAFVTRAGPFDLFREADSIVEPALEAEQYGVFDPLRGAAEAELLQAPSKARDLATSVTQQNIASLFKYENANDFTYRNPDFDLNPSKLTQLFEPTDPYERSVYWGYYTTCIPCPVPYCDCAPTTWADHCIQYYEYMGGDLQSYSFTTYFTRKYRQDSQHEDHFYWEVTIPSTKSILGIFGDLPPITATAKAKPYGGYLGDEPEQDDIPNAYLYLLLDCTCIFGQENNIYDNFYTYKVAHDFQSTYKAKLDALNSIADSQYLEDLRSRFGNELGSVIH